MIYEMEIIGLDVKSKKLDHQKWGRTLKYPPHFVPVDILERKMWPLLE